METEIKNLVIDETYSGLIDAGWCFKLQGNLEVTGSLTVNLKRWLIVSGHIEAGGGIKAGWGIKAGEGIKAGWGIEAGEGIEAGLGIEAGAGIEAKYLNVALRIFAGLLLGRIPVPAEMEIRAKVLSGTVSYGIVVEPKNEDTNHDQRKQAVRKRITEKYGGQSW